MRVARGAVERARRRKRRRSRRGEGEEEEKAEEKAEEEAEEAEEEERSNIFRRPRTISNGQLLLRLPWGTQAFGTNPLLIPSRARGLGVRFSACFLPFLPRPFSPDSSVF
jgi:hypothetical protein